MIERALAGSRYLTFITVILAMIGALILYATSIIGVFQFIADVLSEQLQDPQSPKEIIVGVLKLMDVLLIAIGLQILSLGVYKLFINEKFKLPPAMEVSDFDRLKELIVKVAVIILVIVFLEHAVNLGPSEYILEFGAAVALVIAAAALSIGREKKSSG